MYVAVFNPNGHGRIFSTTKGIFSFAVSPGNYKVAVLPHVTDESSAIPTLHTATPTAREVSITTNVADVDFSITISLVIPREADEVPADEDDVPQSPDGTDSTGTPQDQPQSDAGVPSTGAPDLGKNFPGHFDGAVRPDGTIPGVQDRGTSIAPSPTTTPVPTPTATPKPKWDVPGYPSPARF